MTLNRDFLTTAEVAEMCGVNRATVVRWIQKGDLYAEHTIGGRYRINSKNLLTLSEEKGVFLAPEKKKILMALHSDVDVDDDVEPVREHQPSEEQPPIQQSHILIIDDDIFIRKLLNEFFTVKGYQVTLSDNGFNGLNIILKDYTVNLVILDLLMPGINGVETMRKIKDMRENLPIIVTSGFLEYHFPDGIESLEKEVESVFKKPYDVKELGRICQKLVPASRSSKTSK